MVPASLRPGVAYGRTVFLVNTGNDAVVPANWQVEFGRYKRLAPSRETLIPQFCKKNHGSMPPSKQLICFDNPQAASI
jgi:hypothetical protein